MADKELSALTAAAALTGAELLLITQGGNSRKVTAMDLAQLILAQPDQSITGGARVVTLDLGNLSGTTKTPDPGDRPIQKITNNGAGTIAPGSNQGAYLLVVKNTTGAGAITTSGWQDVSGEAFDTTTTSEFLCHCTVVGDFSAMVINKVA